MYTPDQLKRKVRSILSKYAEIDKVELEGPFVVVYTRNPKDVLDSPDVITTAAKTLKKKIVVLASQAIKDENSTREFIKSLIPHKAEIVDIRFVKETNEVYIVAKRTGYVVGKGGSNIMEILKETGWRPIVIRAPTIKSSFLETFYNVLIESSPLRKRLMKKMAQRIYRPRIGEDRGLYVTFLGAAREVGRSAILINSSESTVVLDAGVSVGGRSPFPRFDLPAFRLDELDAVIITHAHLDHSGALPLLYKYGYKGPVYMTKPTRDLVALLLYDYLQLSERVGITPFFSWGDVITLLSHTVILDYGETVDITPDIKLTFYNAGHILGSSLAHLNVESARYNILYTGDFRYRDTKLLNKAAHKFPRVEALIMESTYCGETDVLPPIDKAEDTLFQIIRETTEKGGKVLIPALAVGRAQEIMVSLVDGFRRGKLPDIPVYLDGMVYDSTAIHSAYPDYLSPYIRERVFKEDKDPFTDPHFNFISGPEERPDATRGGPAVIIAPSGMLAGGPSVEYFKLLAPNEDNAIVLVSYQAEGTLGRKVRDGAKEVILPGDLEPIKVKINAKVYKVEGFSAHADKVQLLAYLGSVEPKPHRVFLVHGEENKIRSFIPLAHKSTPSGIRISAPHVGETFKLA